MEHITGTPREQITLFPEAIEDYISQENPVRFIDALVDSLDLAALEFQKVELADTGRPPYEPGDLLKLYIYGYLNRIRSSRRLEQETHRNLEVMWLLKKLSPDHKTISDFRKDNTSAIRQVCRQFVLLCQKMDLFGGELLAIDGSKFTASNSNRRNFTKQRLKERIERIDTTVDEYLELLETNDRQETTIPKHDQGTLREKIASLKERAQDYKQLLESMEQTGQTQVSLTDPDSRMMNDRRQRDVSYNVQTVVDDKHKLILDHLVTNEANERTLLSRMAKSAKEILGVKQLEVCADKGYWSGTEIQECDENNIITYIPEHASTGKRRSNIPTPEYAHTQFQYDKERDVYLCPQKQELKLTTQTWVHGRWRYEYRTSACKHCQLKSQCTTNKNGRYIYRSEFEEALQRARDRIRAHPEKIEQRKCLSEHPFGTIKHGWNHRYFLLRGLDKVRTEASLSVLAYNIRRVITILTVSTLIQHPILSG